jgi:hypothetical protein
LFFRNKPGRAKTILESLLLVQKQAGIGPQAGDENQGIFHETPPK